MNWLKLKIKINRVAAEAVSNMLLELGSTGIEESDINSEYIEMNGYYPETEKDYILKKTNEGLETINKYLDCSDYKVDVEIVKNSDWENSWKEHFKPFYVADNILIKPSWIDIENESDIIIEMDPGMAFGTGLHETTKLCTLLLKNHIKKNDTVIDLGCGTGILSIIARKLGANNINAVDIDIAAVQSTKTNFKINDIENNFKVYKGDLNVLKNIKADIFVCNIIADVLIEKAEKIRDYLHSNSILILSGIIKDRADEVLEKYVDLGFIKLDKRQMGEWVAYSFKCIDFL